MFSLHVLIAAPFTDDYFPPLFRRVMEAFPSGDLEKAQALQLQAIAVIAVMVSHGGLSAGKAIMALTGLDCGPTRAPLESLTRTQVAALRIDLEQVGFFDLCSRNRR